MRDTRQKRFAVVVGVEFSGRGDEAVAQACEVALSHHGELHAVHVRSPDELEEASSGPGSRAHPERAAEGLARRIWHRVRCVAEGHGWRGRRLPVWVHLRGGSVERALLGVAAKVDADLIVIGSEGTRRGWFDRMLSRPLVEPLHRESSCPVLLARRKRPSSIPPPVGGNPRGGPIAWGYDGARVLTLGD